VNQSHYPDRQTALGALVFVATFALVTYVAIMAAAVRRIERFGETLR
jgi:hypothetical protein